MRIEHLAEHRDVIPTLAGWVWDQWGHLLPDETLTTLTARFQQKITPRRIPEIFVALDGDAPVGMASLIEHDLDARPDLSPWLASVYVLPAYRQQGLGAQ